MGVLAAWIFMEYEVMGLFEYWIDGFELELEPALERCHLFDFQPKTGQPKAKIHINEKNFAQKLQ
ncbi:hypothetical protein [Flagellimonas baculiformis]|uniref:hypothetical protein n=1 Tax=Flagellimonas baculiformis TaxID=3067310 RepID=UPI00296E31CC|nr:hypothetical protein [Muricauda sp. D6]